MAWIVTCIVLVSLFQASSHGAEIAEARSVREGDRAANLKPDVDFGSFVFPEWSSKASNDRGDDNLIISDECERIGICDDIPNYPEELVAKLLKDVSRKNLTKFNKDVLEVPQIAERIGPEDESIELCSSVQRLYAPRAAKDIDSQWQVIVNDKQNPQQTFRVEICQNTNLACSSVAFFPPGYESKCIQKYMLRTMMSMNEKNEPVERPFQVPSCCSCVVKQVS